MPKANARVSSMSTMDTEVMFSRKEDLKMSLKFIVIQSFHIVSYQP